MRAEALRDATRKQADEAARKGAHGDPDRGARRAVSQTYRGRWSLENVFQALTTMFKAELDTLGCPRAALLGFAVALAAYNVLSTVQAVLRGAFGAVKIGQEVSIWPMTSASTTTVGIALGPTRF